MTDGRLRFQVQGSGKKPYQLVAEGEGPTFRIFCSCPGGRLGGKFCKHAAALVVGDVSRLVHPSDDVSNLRAMRDGSPLEARAVAYVPARRERATAAAIADAARLYTADIEALGWIVRLHDDASGQMREIALHDLTRYGKVRVSPKFALSHEPDAWISVAQIDGDVTREHLGARARPWITRTPKGAVAYASCESATAAFATALGLPIK